MRSKAPPPLPRSLASVKCPLGSRRRFFGRRKAESNCDNAVPLPPKASDAIEVCLASSTSCMPQMVCSTLGPFPMTGFIMTCVRRIDLNNASSQPRASVMTRQCGLPLRTVLEEVANGNGIGKQQCHRLLRGQTKLAEPTPTKNTSARRSAVRAQARSAPATDMCLWRVCNLPRELPVGTHL
jgi:hypothetical protein